MNKKSNDWLVFLAKIFGFLLLSAIGVILLLLSPDNAFLQALGTSLIVSGLVAVLLEIVSSLRRNDFRERLDRISAETKELDQVIREAKNGIGEHTKDTKEGFEEVLESLKGRHIQMLTLKRRGDSRFHIWFLEKRPQELFFAGHSVLHRIEADFAERELGSVSEAFKKKLKEGSHLRILFLDPTWDFMNQIAGIQRQDPVDLRTDLCTTLGICKTIWENVKDEKQLAGDIEIRTCRALTQYAFHHVRCRDIDRDEMLIGLYFAGKTGTESPLFRVEHETIRDFFTIHFGQIFDNSKKILVYSYALKKFDHDYYRECQESLAEYLGSTKVSELCA